MEFVITSKHKHPDFDTTTDENYDYDLWNQYRSVNQQHHAVELLNGTSENIRDIPIQLPVLTDKVLSDMEALFRKWALSVLGGNQPGILKIDKTPYMSPSSYSSDPPNFFFTQTYHGVSERKGKYRILGNHSFNERRIFVTARTTPQQVINFIKQFLVAKELDGYTAQLAPGLDKMPFA